MTQQLMSSLYETTWIFLRNVVVITQRKYLAMLALPNMITFKIFVTALIIFLDRLSILNYIN